MDTDLSINPQKITDKVTSFIREKLKLAGFSKLIIGLSGGVDSSVSLLLAARAINPRDIYVLNLPYGKLDLQGKDNAALLIRQIGLPAKNFITINIKPIVDKIVGLDKSFDQLRRGNLMARVRMTLIYDQAKKLHCLVIGTENKTESLLGYFTRFGDEAADIELLKPLYKTQVWQLAAYLRTPAEIINKKPTAGLWTGQTDEEELGFSYKTADQVLFLANDRKLLSKEIVKKGFDQKTVEKILLRQKNNGFKHRLPYIWE